MQRLKHAIGVAAALCLCATMYAQTPNANTAFTASRILSGGTPVTGTLTIKAVDQNGLASSLSSADGYFYGQDANGNIFSVPVTAGALPSGFTVPDQSTAAFTRTAANRYLVDVYGVPASAITQATRPLFEVTLPANTVTGSTFAFDKYAPVQVAAVLPPGLVSAPTVPSSCIAPSLYYPTSPDANGNYKMGKCVGNAFKFDSNTGTGGSTAFAIGTVGTGTAAVSLSPNPSGGYLLNFVLPQGTAGQNGATPGITVGTVTTGAAGSSAAVAIDPSSTPTNIKLNFTIPQGAAGASGSGSSIALKVNGTANGSQTVLNLKAGNNVTLADDGSGGITIASTGGTTPAATTSAPGTVQLGPNATSNTLSNVATSGNAGDLTSGTTSSLINPGIPAGNINVTAAPYFMSPYGATTTTTSAAVASGATSVPLTSASTFTAGNGILVTGGGTTGWTGSDYIGVVIGVSGNTLTVSPALSAAAASGAVVKHDESAAMNAITSYCKTIDCGVYFPPIPGTSGGAYRMNGPILDTAQSNAMVVFPQTALVGGTGNAFRMYSTTRPVSAANAVQVFTDYSLSNTVNIFGVKVNGGPYGGFSNVYVSLSNLRFNNSSSAAHHTMIDCTYCKGFTSDGSIWITAASGDTGLKYPFLSNDVDVSSQTTSILGYTNGSMPGEHAVLQSVHGANMSCTLMLDSRTNLNNVVGHANSVMVNNVWSQLVNSLVCGGTSPQNVFIASADAEVVQNICNDPNNYLTGDIFYHVPYNDGRTSQTITGPPNKIGCQNVRLHNMDTGQCYGLNCPALSYSTASLPSGLVERWKMNDGSGTTNADSVASNNLTNANVTYTASSGYPSNTATFNGTSSYARAASTSVAQITGTAPFTACTWHTPSQISNGDRWFMGTWDANSANGWGLEDGYGAGDIFVYIGSGSSNYMAVAFHPSLVANNRYSVCMTYDGSKTAAGINLYVNGAAVSGRTTTKDAFSTGTISSPTGYFTLGARGDGSGPAGFWSGVLGDTALWSRVLTATEANSVYQAGPVGW